MKRRDIKGRCVACKKFKKVHRDKITKELICENCKYYKDSSRWEKCSLCGKKKNGENTQIGYMR